MDTGGDGQLGSDEVKYGFEQIMGQKYTDEQIQEIMDNVDCDTPKNGFIDFTDFLIASVRIDEKSFLGYMDRAYERFFDDEDESIEIPDLIDALCTEKVMKSEFITHVTESIDEDGSQVISAQEFVEFVIKNLGLEYDFSIQDIFDHLAQL